DLFAALKRLARSGLSVVLITHKLREVKAIADRVTVLRRGEVVMTGEAAQYSIDELARALVGDGDGGDALSLALGQENAAASVRPSASALEVTGLTVRGKAGRRPPVSDATLSVRVGEIVAIAAVEGNGQRELMRAIAGLEPYEGTC